MGESNDDDDGDIRIGFDPVADFVKQLEVRPTFLSLAPLADRGCAR